MNEKLLYRIITFTGIICFFLYLSSRFLPLMNLILVEKMDIELQEFTKYGDLYYNNCISHFKQDLPDQLRRYRLSDKNPDMGDADLLTYGDSFFDVSFQKTLPERLTDAMDNQVFSYITQNPFQSNPFCLLNENGYQKTANSKIIIVETAERNIPTKFGTTYESDCKGRDLSSKNLIPEVVNEYLFKSNDELLFNLMLKKSYLSFGIYSFFSTLKFNWFGSISSMTPLYQVSPEPWLFYSNSIDNGPGSFYYDFTTGEIDSYADNIVSLSKELKDLYNLEMVFMAVPNKISLYSEVITNDQYNSFIPALQHALELRGVKYVDLYSSFISSTDTLYYGTDTHWNKKGVDMALELTLSTLQEGMILEDNSIDR